MPKYTALSQFTALYECLSKDDEKQGITEKLKAEDQMLWVGRMNNIQNSAREIVYNDLIYA